MKAHLDHAWDYDLDKQVRRLTREEDVFIAHEILRCKADYEYAATRYHMISAEATGLKPLYPLWESQRVLLDCIARTELLREQEQWGGVFVNVGKARQLGVTTQVQSIMSHKATTQADLRMLCSSDVEDSSVHMFGIFETILQHLPWWLKPKVVVKSQGRRRNFNTGTHYWAEWGKSGRGGLQDKGGQKGNLGRGKTASQWHLTELSTWEYPQQLVDGFFPTVPMKPSSFGVGESTSKGRGGNWWYQWWTLTDAGKTDFVNCFIPWFAEITKYSRPAPVDWSPDAETLSHAARAERVGPKYLARSVHLTRDQLYFWERKRKEFDEQDLLYKFYEEYPAEPEESFQYSGKSCFPIKVIERIRSAARPPIVCTLQPQTAAAHITHEARQRLEAQELGIPYTYRPTSQESTNTSAALLLPDGYGFRRLSAKEMHERSTLLDTLQIWEVPRRKGPRDYIISVDVSDGLGANRSVADVFRVPTIAEPCEQVAQFITDSRTPVQLAYVVDALGRWYTNADNYEALVAIEVNNHGLSCQDTLQLHLGYGRFYIWEYYDAALPAKRISTKIGWATTPKTRPIILSRFYDAVTTLDPITHKPDLVLHSEWTLKDMQDFVTETGQIMDGEAAPGCFDDGVMSGAIGIYVAWRQSGGEHVPLDERRRQRAAEQEEMKSRSDQQARDWRSSGVPADFAAMFQRPEDDPGDPDVLTALVGDRPPLDNNEQGWIWRDQWNHVPTKST